MNNNGINLLNEIYNKHQFKDVFYDTAKSILELITVEPMEIVYYPYTENKDNHSNTLHIYFTPRNDSYPHVLRIAIYTDVIESMVSINNDSYVSDGDFNLKAIHSLARFFNIQYSIYSKEIQ